MSKEWLLNGLLGAVIYLAGVSVSYGAEVKVLGLFADKVLLQVNGESKVLRTGEKYAGIEIISADSKTCVIKNNGQIQTLTLGTDVGVQFKQLDDAVVRIPKDEKGMYRTQGKINNQTVDFLVDTGATQLAMNLSQAQALNIALPEDKKTQVETASGKATAYQVTLQSVNVGEITVYDVPALIVDGEAPYQVLLGMTFLKRVEMNDKDSVLELRKKY